MEQKRIQTLEALENFIQTNKTLLERTYTDIERLKALRAEVEDGSVSSLQELTEKLDEPCFKLSSHLDGLPPLPPTLDWSAFPSADVTPFTNMATAAREAYAARATVVPSNLPKAHTSTTNALRQLVATQRAAILDPILSAFRLPDDLAALSSSDEEVDPEEERRAREREKIRELKKRRIESDGDIRFPGPGTRRPIAAVFVRRDQEDESAEVDISMADDESARLGTGAGSTLEAVPMVVDTPTTATGAESFPPVERAAPTRERRASRKAQENAKNEAAAAKAKVKAKAKAKTKPQANSNAEPLENEEQPAPDEPPLGKNGKAKSETYKQAWSVSEQHLLERLLEEIPDGEKNRWLKISKAMNGRRTARQVASRVQKYYEKLKKFGIEVAPGGSKLGFGALASAS